MQGFNNVQQGSGGFIQTASGIEATLAQSG